MNNSKDTQAILLEILKKCEDDTSSVERSLQEGTTSNLIVEAIDEKDVEEVRRAITKGRDRIKDLENFVKDMSIDMKEVTDYSDLLKQALDRAQVELAKANFDTGSVSSFFGQTITLPQITKAAIALYTRTNEFTNGLFRAMKNIQDNILPLIKDENEQDTLRSLAGKPPFPPPKELEDVIKKAMTKSLGGDLFGKLKSFFGKPLTGAEKKVMDSIPKVDLGALSGLISAKLMDATIKDLKMEPPKEETKIQQSLEEPARAAAEAAPEAVAAAEESGEGQSGSTQSGSSDEPPPPPPEKAAEEQEAAEVEIKAAVKDVSKDKIPPKAAAFKAMDDWAVSLSASAQKELKAKNRMGDLKDLVGMALDDAAKAVESEVAAAVQAWRDEHEEQLIKNKRFSKKSFDSLQGTIPKLAAFMMKAKNESARPISSRIVKKFVYKQLDKMFLQADNNIISENQYKYTESEMIVYKMNRLAGLDV